MGRQAAVNPLLPLYQPADGPGTPEAWLERCLERNPGEMAETSRRLLARNLRTLAYVKRRLRCPVYLRGPRRGKPMDAVDVVGLRARAGSLRAWIVFNQAIIARAEPGPIVGDSA